MKTFRSEWSYMGKFDADKFTEDDVRREPQLFNSGADFSQRFGGPITRAFLDALVGMGYKPADMVMDSRVHMLKPGWFPCIPGWHIDDFNRGDNGQPDLTTINPNLCHIMALVGDASRTEFLDGPVTLVDPRPGAVVYDSYNRQIRRHINAQEVGSILVEPGTLIRFGASDFHRGTAATKSGWRWFGRVTMNSGRVETNEIRTQTQVYLPWPEAGW